MNYREQASIGPGVRGRAFRASRGCRGFTLVELLVVISVIAILASLLLPALAAAKARGRRALCVSNLRQTGIAIHVYADDSLGLIPYGPTAPPFTSPSDLYPTTGSPTSLLSLRNGAPVGLGLLLKDYLASTPRVLFCPDNDQRLDAEAELARVGKTQAQGGYFYRHAGITELFATPEPVPPHLRLENLGENRKGLPIRVLAMDSQFLSPPDLESYNVKPRTNHRQASSTVLSADGHVDVRVNRDGRFTVDVRDYADLRDSFSRILAAFEEADRER